MDKNQAFVIFKKPLEKNYNYISGPWLKTNDYQNLSSGYLMAPFDIENQEAYFIEGKTAELSILPKDIDTFSSWKLVCKKNTPSLPDYKKLVSEAVDVIKNRAFQKLVLSRCETNAIPEDFSIKRYFENISNAYPECFVYLFYIPNEVCWLGASPEVLAKTNLEGEFKTIALAGTIHQDKLAQGENWSEKEIVEQALVTKFILEKLKKYSKNKIDSKGPDNVQTGNLIHLQTRIKTKVSSEKALDLVLKLHPTPAVSGLPQKESIKYIIENEFYKREYYSGFSGIIEDESVFEFYVNLRCMQLLKEEAILYAGAGITSDSIPEKEYIETANKINALKRFLNAASNTL